MILFLKKHISKITKPKGVSKKVTLRDLENKTTIEERDYPELKQQHTKEYKKSPECDEKSVTHEDKWIEKYEQLEEYKRLHGTANIPSTNKEYKELSVWLRNQRASYRNGKLPKDREKRLSELGVTLVFREAKRIADCSWEEYIDKFKAFCDLYGHNLPNKEFKVGSVCLGSWASNVRSLNNRGELSIERRNQLDELNFPWNVSEEIWDYKFKELEDFFEENQHLDVDEFRTQRTYDNASKSLNAPLGKWVKRQRELMDKGQLDESKVRKLKEIGLDTRRNSVILSEKKWNENFEKLRQHEHVNYVTHKKTDPFYPLSIWSNNQRMAYRNGKLSEDRINKLESIGFVWSLEDRVINRQWEINYSKYKRFLSDKSTTDDTLKILKTQDIPLHRWAKKQQDLYVKGLLEEEKIAFLKEVDSFFENKKTSVLEERRE